MLTAGEGDPFSQTWSLTMTAGPHCQTAKKEIILLKRSIGISNLARIENDLLNGNRTK